MVADKDPTVIKKYANRRLYHTGTSSYVTLEDLALLVRNGEEFVVYDAKSGEDITRSVLAQIIFEEESKTGQNLLPIAFLRQLIRFYGDSMQVLVPRYLEMSIDSLTREQHTFRAHMAKAFPSRVIEVMEAQTRANMQMFTDAFRLFTPFASGVAAKSADAGGDAAAAATVAPGKDAGKDAGAGAGKSAASAAEEIDQLRRDMAAMRNQLDKLSQG
jgi:polyhydroxyalkanoate synthesis repressor PhaR